MKLEYFADGNLDCPLILLYGVEPECIKLLQVELNKLIQGQISQLFIHDLPGFISVNNCQLFVSAGKRDIGVRNLAAANQFECILQVETLQQVIELLDPFATNPENDGVRFQYLDDSGPIAWLISRARSW
ncbi:MAG: hypothetical protein KDI30_05680 [Pseudomonadales bacterium]|nr:hypothetical protein [Pseudomonadales bacterium]